MTEDSKSHVAVGERYCVGIGTLHEDVKSRVAVGDRSCVGFGSLLKDAKSCVAVGERSWFEIGTLHEDAKSHVAAVDRSCVGFWSLLEDSKKIQKVTHWQTQAPWRLAGPTNLAKLDPFSRITKQRALNTNNGIKALNHRTLNHSVYGYG